MTALDLHKYLVTPSSAVTPSSGRSSGRTGDAMYVAIDSSIVPGRVVELGAMCGRRSWLRAFGSVPDVPQLKAVDLDCSATMLKCDPSAMDQVIWVDLFILKSVE